MRATASREVSASADTNIVMMHRPHSCGRPSCATSPVTPTENLVNGVAPSASAMALRLASSTPLALRLVSDPTTTMTKTASRDSKSMLP